MELCIKLESSISFLITHFFVYLERGKGEGSCPTSSSIDIVRFYVLDWRIDLYVDKLEGLIDIRYEVVPVNEVTKRRARGRKRKDTERRGWRKSLILLSIARMLGERHTVMAHTYVTSSKLRGRNWFSVCLFDWNTLSVTSARGPRFGPRACKEGLEG